MILYSVPSMPATLPLSTPMSFPLLLYVNLYEFIVSPDIGSTTEILVILFAESYS